MCLEGVVLERFWAKVDKTGDCWLWTGALSSGYGSFGVGRTSRYAHRIAYELATGEDITGLDLDHRTTCPKRCIRPTHLRPATRKQNIENRAGLNGNNTSGYRNVFRHNGRWRVQIMHAGRKLSFGLYGTPEEANEVAVAARLRLFTHNDLDRGGRHLSFL